MDIFLWILVVSLVLLTVDRVAPSPIWRCPDFRLLPCKTPPKHCSSFRMIYIRHIHLECPACLICTDSLVPWASPQSTSQSKPARRKLKQKRRRKRARRMRKRMLQQQSQLNGNQSEDGNVIQAAASKQRESGSRRPKNRRKEKLA